MVDKARVDLSRTTIYSPIDVANPESRLKPGMTANVSITLAERSDVLKVPNAALRFRPPESPTAESTAALTSGLVQARAAGAAGTMFADAEVRTAAKVALLGSTVARELFGDGDPVGEIIRIRNIPFVVMGLLSTKGTSMMGSDQDDIVLVPYTSAMKRLTGSTTISRFAHRLRSPSSPPRLRGS